MIFRVGRGKRVEEKDEDDDDDDEEEEEESSEEESEEEEAEDEAATSSKAPAKQAELTRTERRQQKKQKGAAKQQKDGEDDDEDEDEDPVLANPNLNVGKKMTISDLSAPRQLSRRERYVSFFRIRARSHIDEQGGEGEEGRPGTLLESKFSIQCAVSRCSRFNRLF